MNADILLRISDGSVCEEGCECSPTTRALAVALLASLDDDRRPILGLVTVCEALLAEVGANARRDLETIVHEIIHALVRSLRLEVDCLYIVVVVCVCSCFLDILVHVIRR